MNRRKKEIKKERMYIKDKQIENTKPEKS